MGFQAKSDDEAQKVPSGEPSPRDARRAVRTADRAGGASFLFAPFLWARKEKGLALR